jgi:hypothetical protein
MLKKMYILLALMLLSLPAISQKYLLLSKATGRLRYEIFPGQPLRYKLQDDKSYQQDIIRGLGKDEIYFTIDTVNINDIRTVDVSKLNPSRGISLNRWGTAFITSGVLLVFFDGFHDTVMLEENIEIDDSIWIASGSLVGAGILMKILKRRKFRVDRKNNLIQIIEVF